MKKKEAWDIFEQLLKLDYAHKNGYVAFYDGCITRKPDYVIYQIHDYDIQFKFLERQGQFDLYVSVSPTYNHNVIVMPTINVEPQDATKTALAYIDACLKMPDPYYTLHERFMDLLDGIEIERK